MTRSRRIAVSGACLAAMLLCLPASASGTAPLVTDLANDANGLGTPHIPGGQIRALFGDLLDTDPFGGGVATGPASVASVDILSVDYRTGFEAIPVGDDGIDYRATDLFVHLRTAATPASPAGSTSFTVYQHLREEGGGVCRSAMRITLSPGHGPGTYPVVWSQENQFESFCPREGGTGTHPAWTATVDAGGVLMRIPFSSIEGVEDYYVHEGGVIGKTLGITQATTIEPQWDRTPFGGDWTIGQDMPADVPCTRGCP